MNAEKTIRNALHAIMSEGDANACRIWKGYDMAGQWGWHIERFGMKSNCYGRNLAEVLEAIDAIADHQSEVNR